MTVPKPNIEEVQRALLLVSRVDDVELGTRRLLAEALLPHTDPDTAYLAVLDIREFLTRAHAYADVTPKQAQAWFCDTDCGHEATPAAYAQCLRERAAAWAGEAEVLAMNTALNDVRAVQTTGGGWVVPS